MSNPAKDRPDTDESVDHQPGDATSPLDADEGEPDVEPFGGDDDLASGQLGPDANAHSRTLGRTPASEITRGSPER